MLPPWKGACCPPTSLTTLWVQKQMQLPYLLVLQLCLHLAEAVCLLGLIVGDAGQELEHMVVAMAVLIISIPGTLQVLGPAGVKSINLHS